MILAILLIISTIIAYYLGWNTLAVICAVIVVIKLAADIYIGKYSLWPCTRCLEEKVIYTVARYGHGMCISCWCEDKGDLIDDKTLEQFLVYAQRHK